MAVSGQKSCERPYTERNIPRNPKLALAIYYKIIKEVIKEVGLPKIELSTVCILMLQMTKRSNLKLRIFYEYENVT